jgi:hypothetical protein
MFGGRQSLKNDMYKDYASINPYTSTKEKPRSTVGEEITKFHRQEIDQIKEALTYGF